MSYRSENGKLAAGVPKAFSQEERDRRRLHMAKVQASRLAKIEARKRVQAEQRALVKRMASLKVFVPVESFEKI